MRIEGGRRRERPAVEHDPVVRLIRQQVDAPVVRRGGLIEDGRELGQRVRLVDPARGVMGRVHDDGSGPRRQGGADRLQIEIERRAGRLDTDRRHAAGEDQRLVEEPGRRDVHDLVARIGDRAEHDREPGEVPVRHVDVLGGERHVEPRAQTRGHGRRGRRGAHRVGVVIRPGRLDRTPERIDVRRRRQLVRVAEQEVGSPGRGNRAVADGPRRERPDRVPEPADLFRWRAHLALLRRAEAEVLLPERLHQVPTEHVDQRLDLALVRRDRLELQVAQIGRQRRSGARARRSASAAACRGGRC